ncbi:MAG: VWA domain-containing protein [Armatimonadota bacterium]|nr:VWA domain-containing protein [Armatimonadota bacterium]MDW8155886.1 VWA domain-containing protein [Armatimonadota bacterium]
MQFLWPEALWGLVALPGLAGVAVWFARRRAVTGWHHPQAAWLATASPRRRLAPTLYFGALAAVAVGLARPTLPLHLPVREAAVALSIDVSGSMRSQDMRPNRLEAAKEAARAFVRRLPADAAVALVAFAGTAELLQPLTRDHGRVLRALDDLTFRPRTAIGEGLLEAVAALPGRVRVQAGLAQALPAPRTRAVVVLLSDGRSNTGADPLEAAEVARRQNVVVYTVGIGDPAPRDGLWTIGGPLDEQTLKEIARRTGGQYFHAASGAALSRVYRELAYRVGWETRREEVSGVLALVAAGALVAAWYAGSRAYRIQ